MNRISMASELVSSACDLVRRSRPVQIALGVTVLATGIASGTYLYYRYVQNSDTKTKKLRAIERLYYEHENFFMLRRNWEETMKSLLGEAERLMLMNKQNDAVRTVSTAAAFVALVHNEEKAETLLKSILSIPDFKDLENKIQTEFVKDMDAVQCILSAELNELSPGVLDELKLATKSQMSFTGK